MREFKSNDSKKGRSQQIAPLSESDRAGLIEVITRANQLDKLQGKEQALPRDEARRLHSHISDLATEAQKFLDRYKLSCESGEKDIRTVSRGLARRESAITRGRISHSRMADDFVTDRSRSGSKNERLTSFPTKNQMMFSRQNGRQTTHCLGIGQDPPLKPVNHETNHMIMLDEMLKWKNEVRVGHTGKMAVIYDR